MSNTPAVTIAMRTFDRPLMLRRAIADVLAQTFDDWRLAVHNNGGDRDLVEQIVGEFADSARGRIDVIHSSQQLPPGAAVNAALVSEFGEFLVVHDDDDTWHAEFLERTVTHLRSASSEVAAVAVRLDCVTERVAEGGEIETVAVEPFTPYLERVNFGSVLIANPFPPIGLLVRADRFTELGGYDASLPSAVDWQFLLRILETHRVEVIRETLANYHLRPQGTGSYANIVSDRTRMRESDHRVIAHYLDDALHRGELSPSNLALAISEVDIENDRRSNELLDHVRAIRLLAGDIEFRSLQIRELLVFHDETFAAMRSLLAPFVLLTRGTRAFRR